MTCCNSKKSLIYLIIGSVLLFAGGYYFGEKGYCNSKRGHDYTEKHRTFHHDRTPEQITEKMTKELSLSDDQVVKMTIIVDKFSADMAEKKTQFRDQFKIIKDAKVSEIHAILTPEQIEKFSKLRATHDSKFNKTTACKFSSEKADSK